MRTNAIQASGTTAVYLYADNVPVAFVEFPVTAGPGGVGLPVVLSVALPGLTEVGVSGALMPVDFILIFPKSGVPRPVTGSQPGVAAKPVIPLVGSLQLPCAPPTTSFSMFAALLYNHGFRNPSGDKPCARRSPLRRAMMAANVGVEALVPLQVETEPLATTAKRLPCAETSGYPRPVAL